MKKNILFALAFIALMAACKEPIKTEATNNAEFRVELLFEHDGCKVYRFSDFNGYKYFVVQEGRAAVNWDVQEGKRHSVNHEIQTVTKQP